MKVAVFYKTLLGTTRKYAQWITEEVQADIFTYAEVKPGIFEPYDVVIIASGTYAGKMPLVGFLENNWGDIKGKKVIVLAIGMVPPDNTQSFVSFELIPKKIRKKIFYFKLPGKLFRAGEMGEPGKDKLELVFAKIKNFKSSNEKNTEH